MQSKTIDAYGTKVHYLEGGEGAPLLPIHGIGESAYSWSENANTLAQSFHVYAPDIVGWGFTPPSPQHDYTGDSLGKFVL
ncbi:MAG: alpha/beta fold hydrolase, partial [Chloroflexi bacterium]|nr:alpha/beta fold hydrolase [Chloroflexota bacterium]